ncbi:MAG TPA: NADPH:quinone reductase [Jatrophihabitantaceae bacterium]
MRAVIYRETGPSGVLRIVDRPIAEPGPDEVRVRVHLSGVNPTDWKAREGGGRPAPFPEVVPNQDGAGVIDAVGPGVDPARVGERVWIWEAAYRRADGTAQEYVVLPSVQAVGLPDSASFELGASLGIPFLTAHRCLTVNEGGPERLAPGALDGRTVLVAGGAGAVGNAAIQLARWAGASVIATVSSPAKAQLAKAAGANEVIDYRAQDVVAEIRAISARGVDTIVEVAAANAAIDAAVIGLHGTVAIYASGGGDLTLPVRPLLAPNARWQFVLVYTLPDAAKIAGIEAVRAAVADGALRVGDEAGLPLHHFPLEQAAAAHDAVQAGAVGKVLIDL